MNLLSAVSELIEEPRIFVASRLDSGKFYRPGFSAYLLGTLSLYVFFRLFSAVPPGLYSFANLLLLSLAVNFMFAAAIHLFLELTGAEGGAVKLFFLFGFSELLWALLIPFGFLAKLGYLDPAPAFIICFILVVTARMALLRRLYAISKGKALLALSLPYAAAAAALLMASVYAVVYMIWVLA